MATWIDNFTLPPHHNYILALLAHLNFHPVNLPQNLNSSIPIRPYPPRRCPVRPQKSSRVYAVGLQSPPHGFNGTYYLKSQFQNPKFQFLSFLISSSRCRFLAKLVVFLSLECYSELKVVLKTDAQCLCGTFKKIAYFVVSLNVTKGNDASAACHLSAPSSGNCASKFLTCFRFRRFLHFCWRYGFNFWV